MAEPQNQNNAHSTTLPALTSSIPHSIDPFPVSMPPTSEGATAHHPDSSIATATAQTSHPDALTMTTKRNRTKTQRLISSAMQAINSVNATDNQKLPPVGNRHYAFATLNLNSDGSTLTYNSAKAGPHAALWEEAEHIELSKLLDTLTIIPLQRRDMPADRRSHATYYNPQVKEKLLSDGTTKRRIRGTAGGDRITYPGSVTSHAAELETFKTLINAMISEDALWSTADITDFYLNTPLARYEYIIIKRKQLPQKTIDKYKLEQYINNDQLLVEVRKGIYGLPQAGLLAQQRLIKHLATHGYYQCAKTACLFRHETRDIAFTLIVDDFGIKHKGEGNLSHLLNALT